MDEAPRRSTRVAKKLRKEDFLYDEEILDEESLNLWQRSNYVTEGNGSPVLEDSVIASFRDNHIDTSGAWSEKTYNPYYLNIRPSGSHLSQQNKVLAGTGRRSQGEEPNSPSLQVNKHRRSSITEAIVEGGSRRKHIPRSVKGSFSSSTRDYFLDISDNFLDLSDNFLSMSPTLDTESSEMASDSEPRCSECEECTQGQVCTRSPIVRPSGSANITEANVMEKMMRTLQEQDRVLKKVDILSKEVNSLKM